MLNLWSLQSVSIPAGNVQFFVNIQISTLIIDSVRSYLCGTPMNVILVCRFSEKW
jgi:hypothetical protein